MRTIHPFHREGWNAHGVLDSLVKEGPDAAQEVRLYVSWAFFIRGFCNTIGTDFVSCLS